MSSTKWYIFHVLARPQRAGTLLPQRVAAARAVDVYEVADTHCGIGPASDPSEDAAKSVSEDQGH